MKERYFITKGREVVARGLTYREAQRKVKRLKEEERKMNIKKGIGEGGSVYLIWLERREKRNERI